jgi:hypothetical protein
MFINGRPHWVWWHTIIIPTLGRLKKEDLEFEDSQDYITSPYQTKT